MSREIFSLHGIVEASGLKQVVEGLQAIDKQLVKVDKAFTQFGRQTAKIGTTLSKNITAPLVAVGAAVVLATNKTLDYAENLVKLEGVTGLSTDSLQELQHVAKMMDVDFESLTGTVSMFARQLPAIAKEGGPAFDALRRLGVNIYDSSGQIRNINDLFPELIKKIQLIQNPLERVSIAQRIFGRSAAELGPILGMTAKQFDSMREEARSMGIVIEGSALKSAEALGDEVEKLKERFGAIIIKLAMEFLPILRDDILPLIQTKVIPVIQGFADKIKGVIEWFKSLDSSSKTLITAIIGIMAIAGPFLLIIGKTILAVKGLAVAANLLKTAFLTNPFGVAFLGATALVGVLITLDNLYHKREKQKLDAAKDAAITKELQEFIKLRNEQQAIIDTGEASHFQLYSRESVAQARANLKTISEAARTFNKENGLAGPEAPEAPPAPLPPPGESESKFSKRIKKFQEESDKRNELTFARKKIDDEMRKSELDAIDKEVNAEQAAAEEKKRINQSWADKVAEQVLSVTELMDRNRQQDLEAVKGNKEAEAKVNAYYDNLIAAAHLTKAQEQRQLFIQSVQNWLGAVQTLVDGISSLLSMATQNRLQEIENQNTAETEAINNSSLSEEQKKKKIDDLNADTAKREKDIKRKAAKDQKAMAIMSAIVGTAVAVVNALGQSGNPILGIVMAAIIGALGLAQIALIAAQPLPLARGAFIKGRRGGVQTEIGEGEQDEIVMPLRTGIQALADGVMNRINSFSTPALAGAGGGMTRTTENHFHIGTLIADDRGIKEFERRASQIRISEEKRKGAD